MLKMNLDKFEIVMGDDNSVIIENNKLLLKHAEGKLNFIKN